jgi:hypothetical protein
VESASCPFGDYDRRVLKELRRIGYRFIYTSDGGAATEAQWLRARITVRRWMSMDDLRQIIQNGPGRWNQFSIELRKLYKRFR